jgi:hypothetical protein
MPEQMHAVCQSRTCLEKISSVVIQPVGAFDQPKKGVQFVKGVADYVERANDRASDLLHVIGRSF